MSKIGEARRGERGPSSPTARTERHVTSRNGHVTVTQESRDCYARSRQTGNQNTHTQEVTSTKMFNHPKVFLHQSVQQSRHIYSVVTVIVVVVLSAIAIRKRLSCTRIQDTFGVHETVIFVGRSSTACTAWRRDECCGTGGPEWFWDEREDGTFRGGCFDIGRCN